VRKRCAGPIARAENDRDDDGLVNGVADEGEFHLNIKAIRRGEEIRAEQQENDLGGAEMFVNFIGPFIANADATVVPGKNQLQAFQDG